MNRGILCAALFLLIPVQSVMAQSSFSMSRAVLTSADCELILESEAPRLSISTNPARITESNTIKYVVNWGETSRAMELPSVVWQLRSLQNLSIVVLAGNTLYEGTYHNLAFHLGDYLIKALRPTGASLEAEKAASGRPYQVNETLSISYDDSTRREGERTLFSEKPLYRTDNGEIFLTRLSNGDPVAIVRPIGDYNEIGDFVAPILEHIDQPSDRVLLIHDDLKEEPLDLIYSEGPISPQGNNSVFSMNRSLAYSAIHKVRSLLANDEPFGVKIDKAELDDFVRSLVERANMRDGDQAFKNAESFLTPIQSFLKRTVQKGVLKDLNSELEEPLKPYRKERGLLMQQLKGNKEISDSEKAMLQDKIDAINAQMAPIEQSIKQEQAQLEDQYQSLVEEIQATVNSIFAFNRLAIGTGGPADPNHGFADFVLSEFPQDKYNDDYWHQVWTRIDQVLTSRP